MHTTVYEVTLRYFAAAHAATGVPEEVVQVAAGSTLGDVLTEAERRHGQRLQQVLLSSSLLVDEVVVSDLLTPARPGSTVDVLPPFAGG